MLRRILTFTFALLLFALAFSIPHRSTTLAALILPQVAIAQATASAPSQTVSDAPLIAQADTGPGTVDTLAAAPADSNSHGILWGTLAVIALMILGVWFWNRRRNRPYVYEPQGGSGKPDKERK